MRNSNYIKLVVISVVLLSIQTLMSCSEDNTSDALTNDVGDIIDTEETKNDSTLTQTDLEALLFMLEEEKLARDTYQFLDDTWSINQFSNIKSSEQKHINLVESLLKEFNIDYTILPYGEFQNQDLQALYNQFIIKGKINKENALQIGATIEDLDIVDLENNLNATTNASIIEVFENLQCGSRNHLRSFVSSIEKSGDTYTPQFLTITEYNLIVNNSHEQCK